jgi:Phage tail protein
MITKFDARTLQGTLLSFPLEDQSSGFVVQGIDGLDPVKATLVSSSFASMDGAQYQSSRRDTRNIVITLGLEPDYVVDTVSSLRKRLMQFFMPKSEVNFRFYTDEGITADISGRVESCDAPLFTNQPKATISIICFDPDFVDTESTDVTGSTVSTNIDRLVEYAGTIETGFIFTLNVNRTLGEFTIYNRTPDQVVRSLDFAASLVAGDILTISTIGGSKSVILNRGGVISSLLYGMSPQSSWVELFPGDNYMRFYATGAAIPYDLSYITRYGGL